MAGTTDVQDKDKSCISEEKLHSDFSLYNSIYAIL